jgi:starch synthase
VTQEALEHALERASALYDDKVVWASLQQAGMKSDVSWTRSAVRYAEVYRAVLKGA